eukprot:GHVT01069898.1.p1 GENE.GHVT01069898.1~~GHVT01069898.1.p1  ORF type:complete len:371 (+),score=18.75 GHVT01069898.1:264-1376(+)
MLTDTGLLTMEARCIPNPRASAPPLPPRNVDASTHQLLPFASDALFSLLDAIAGELAGVNKGIPDFRESRKATVYTGATGIAYALLKLLRTPAPPLADSQTEDKWRRIGQYGEAAKLWLLEENKESSACESDRHPSLAPSIMCGVAGTHFVYALHYLFKEGPKSQKMVSDIRHYVSLARRAVEMESDEWLYGRTGYLNGYLTLRSILQDAGLTPEAIEDLLPLNLQTDVAEKILASGREVALSYSQPMPLMYKWHGELYLGAAHGMMGILFMLMHCTTIMGVQEHREDIRKCCSSIARLETPNHNWPAVLMEERDRLVHFCHGATGAVFLFLKAYEVDKLRGVGDLTLTPWELLSASEYNRITFLCESFL